MNRTIEPVVIEGKAYYRIQQFAMLTNKSESAIRKLISLGNKIRKLKAECIMDTWLIPASEYTEFIFTGPGRSSLTDTYCYKEDGTTYSVTYEGDK